MWDSGLDIVIPYRNYQTFSENQNIYRKFEKRIKSKNLENTKKLDLIKGVVWDDSSKIKINGVNMSRIENSEILSIILDNRI
jgi:hypothetical protein